jgi:hypothetical protein
MRWVVYNGVAAGSSRHKGQRVGVAGRVGVSQEIKQGVMVCVGCR